MALKTRITKDEHAALPDALKEHYKESGGAYVLDSDDANELRRAKDRADEEARIAKEERDRLRGEKEAAEAAARAAEEERVRKSGDVAAIEASWQAKLAAAEAKGKVEADKLRDQIAKLTVDAKAEAIAAEISTVPELIQPLIRARLEADLSGDVPFARVLDATGKPSALSLDDLKKEFVANEKYAAIIVGSKANGGGAGENTPSGAGGPKKINEMTEAERVAHFNKVGEVEYTRQFMAEQST